MTREEKEQLEPTLAPLRKLIGKDDFLELALIYIQMGKSCIVYSIDKHSIEKSLCIGCYDIRNPEADGLMIISANTQPTDVKEWQETHPEYCWVRSFTYGRDIDELLLWISRDGEELQDKYAELTDTVQKALAFSEI